MQSSPEVEFKVGDKAVYPAQGVAEVISIDEKDIAGSRQRFYVLRILDTDRKIMVPVSNANAVGLRQVISEQEIREIFDILKERTIGFDTQTWNRRYRGFMDKIKTGSIYDVAEVIRIEEKDIAGTRQRFYVLRILDTDRKILVPVMNASAVGLRQVISEQEIREIFDILRERTIAFDNQTWNRRYRGFMDKIKTGSIYDVAEVLRDLYRLKTDKQLSFGERRMLDTARTLIVKEIAIARAQTEDQVKTEIEAIFVSN
jgi:CarD family transcriptional regulator